MRTACRPKTACNYGVLRFGPCIRAWFAILYTTSRSKRPLLQEESGLLAGKALCSKTTATFLLQRLFATRRGEPSCCKGSLQQGEGGLPTARALCNKEMAAFLLQRLPATRRGDLAPARAL